MTRSGGRCLAATGRVLGKLRRANRRWDLLPEGQDLAVGLSGGGDSLALLHLLAAEARYRREPGRIVAIHVALDGHGVERHIDHRLVAWCRSRGIEVMVVEPRLVPGEEFPLSCFRCAQIRRRTLLETAERSGIFRVAVGHHADDVVETFLLGLLYTGRPEVLQPKRSYFGGAMTLVRPMWEVPARDIARLVRLCALPVSPSACPVSDESRRVKVRKMLHALGHDERRVRRAVFGAVLRHLQGKDLC